MPEITFKKETAPSRCEICHQADLFDAEQNHCARCASIAIKQMAQASAATIVTLAPPTPRMLRFTGAIPWMLSIGAFLSGGFFVGPRSEFGPVLWLLAILTTFCAGVGLEAFIKQVVRSRTGQLPFNIDRMIDDWFAISCFLTLGFALLVFIGLENLLSLFGIGQEFFKQSPATPLLLLPIVVLSMWLSYRNELRKRRRFLNRTIVRNNSTPDH